MNKTFNFLKKTAFLASVLSCVNINASQTPSYDDYFNCDRVLRDAIEKSDVKVQALDSHRQQAIQASTRNAQVFTDFNKIEGSAEIDLYDMADSLLANGSEDTKKTSVIAANDKVKQAHNTLKTAYATWFGNISTYAVSAASSDRATLSSAQQTLQIGWDQASTYVDLGALPRLNTVEFTEAVEAGEKRASNAVSPNIIRNIGVGISGFGVALFGLSIQTNISLGFKWRVASFVAGLGLGAAGNVVYTAGNYVERLENVIKTFKGNA